MDELKPCPFCGKEAEIRYTKGDPHGWTSYTYYPNEKGYVCCKTCFSKTTVKKVENAVKTWNTRLFVNKASTEKTQAHIFDRCEIYKNCTVEVLKNSFTGDVSYGWWRNDTEWEAT